MDTNVVSDLLKPRPNEHLRRWIEARPEESLYLSVITLGEIRQGIEMAEADHPKRGKLEQALGDLRARFAGRVLLIDDLVAETWGEICGRARNQIGPLPAVDSLIAATALVHRLTVATGNTRHFKRAGVQLLNPFEVG